MCMQCVSVFIVGWGLSGMITILRVYHTMCVIASFRMGSGMTDYHTLAVCMSAMCVFIYGGDVINYDCSAQSVRLS